MFSGVHLNLKTAQHVMRYVISSDHLLQFGSVQSQFMGDSHHLRWKQTKTDENYAIFYGFGSIRSIDCMCGGGANGWMNNNNSWQ